jgi:DNA-binding NarL/FixJ family response regulator
LSDARDIIPSDIVSHDVDSAAADVGSQAREKIHALLIDADSHDSLTLCRVATRSKQLEICITPCRSLDEANALLAQRRFDVIYLEYWLGAETTIAFIHAMAALEGAPCVVLTDLDEPDIRRLAFRAGAHAFLSKDSLSAQALESVTLAVLRPQLSSPQAAA